MQERAVGVAREAPEVHMQAGLVIAVLERRIQAAGRTVVLTKSVR